MDPEAHTQHHQHSNHRHPIIVGPPSSISSSDDHPRHMNNNNNRLLPIDLSGLRIQGGESVGGSTNGGDTSKDGLCTQPMCVSNADLLHQLSKEIIHLRGLLSEKTGTPVNKPLRESCEVDQLREENQKLKRKLQIAIEKINSLEKARAQLELDFEIDDERQFNNMQRSFGSENASPMPPHSPAVPLSPAMPIRGSSPLHHTNLGTSPSQSWLHRPDIRRPISSSSNGPIGISSPIGIGGTSSNITSPHRSTDHTNSHLRDRVPFPSHPSTATHRSLGAASIRSSCSSLSDDHTSNFSN